MGSTLDQVMASADAYNSDILLFETRRLNGVVWRYPHGDGPPLRSRAGSPLLVPQLAPSNAALPGPEVPSLYSQLFGAQFGGTPGDDQPITEEIGTVIHTHWPSEAKFVIYFDDARTRKLPPNTPIKPAPPRVRTARLDLLLHKNDEPTREHRGPYVGDWWASAPDVVELSFRDETLVTSDIRLTVRIGSSTRPD